VTLMRYSRRLPLTPPVAAQRRDPFLTIRASGQRQGSLLNAKLIRPPRSVARRHPRRRLRSHHIFSILTTKDRVRTTSTVPTRWTKPFASTKHDKPAYGLPNGVSVIKIEMGRKDRMLHSGTRR